MRISGKTTSYNPRGFGFISRSGKGRRFSFASVTGKVKSLPAGVWLLAMRLHQVKIANL